jgi:hypothetical protein
MANEFAEELETSDPVVKTHVRFYDSFLGTLKWAVIAIAVLLIMLAIFLVR